MTTYTLKEVSKKINVPTSTIKQWEKDLSDVLFIPRSKQGARIYSEHEISQLLEIKHWEANQLGREEIREILQHQHQDINGAENIKIETIMPALPEEEQQRSSPPVELSKWNQEQFFLAMDQYKETFLNEVKEEIRNVVRTEVVKEMKKEISEGTFYTVKSVSDSLYKANANVQEDIKELSFTVQKTADTTDKTFRSLEKTIADQSIETAEEFYSISKQLAETTEEISHHIDVTNKELNSLSEAFEKEREYFLEDRENFRHEIRQREIAFQGMLSSFRVAASTKEKKWWKFW